MTGTDNDVAGAATTGFTMLGAPDAQVCDEDGVCEVTPPRPLQMEPDAGHGGG